MDPDRPAPSGSQRLHLAQLDDRRTGQALPDRLRPLLTSPQIPVNDLGGVTYALRGPDPWPRWFWYHEIFHACTIAAFACQYIAVSIVVYHTA